LEFINQEVKVASIRDEVRIVAMGCIHHGAAGCDEKLADFWYNYVLNTPNAYCVLGGDLVDSIHERDKRYLDEEVAPWCFGKRWGGTLIDRQYHYALAKWKPLAEAGKILWIHSGNHEHKLKTQASRDLTLDWSRELTKMSEAAGHRAVPYAGLSALTNLIVRPDRANGGSYRLSFFTQHGGGGAVSDGGIINKASSMLTAYDVDVALMWHVHRQMHLRVPMWSITDTGRLSRRERIGAVCGTFLSGHTEGVASYAELKGYKPQSLGPLVIHFKREVQNRTKAEPNRATGYTRLWVSDAVRSAEEE
jgi:hypothetical protein